MTLSDLLTTDVTTAAPETAVADVVAAFRRGDDCVAVLDEGRPLGFVTAATVGRAVDVDDSLGDTPVSSLLEDTPVTLPRSADRETLLSTLAATGERRIAVVDDDGSFVGLVTLDSLVAAYGRELVAVIELLERHRG